MARRPSPPPATLARLATEREDHGAFATSAKGPESRPAREPPKASVVKAFTIYGFENLENPAYPAYNVKPAMFFCGDDRAAKEGVGKLITDCGFEPLDVGGLVQALHLEHMTLLWVRMVRVGGHSPNLVWAALRR